MGLERGLKDRTLLATYKRAIVLFCVYSGQMGVSGTCWLVFVLGALVFILSGFCAAWTEVWLV